MKPIRAVIGAITFAAPIMLGVAVTSGVDVSGSGEGGIHTVDQWTIEEAGSGEFTLDREQVGQVITLVVTGPDGHVLAESDYPDFVAEAADEFGDENWQPAGEDTFSHDGAPCYDVASFEEDFATGVPEGEDFWEHTMTTDDSTFSIKVHADGTMETAFFDRFVSIDELSSIHESGGSYADLEGVQPLPPC